MIERGKKPTYRAALEGLCRTLNRWLDKGITITPLTRRRGGGYFEVDHKARKVVVSGLRFSKSRSS